MNLCYLFIDLATSGELIMSNINNINTYYNIPTKERNDISEMLVEGLHEYKGIPRNIEFENYILLQSKIENKLTSMIETGGVDKIFTQKIQNKIKKHAGKSFDEIKKSILKKDGSVSEYIKREYPFTTSNKSQLQPDSKTSTHNYGSLPDYILKILKIQERECILLPLYALASGNSWEDATFFLADELDYHHENCSDLEIPGDKLDDTYYVTHEFNLYNKNNDWNYAYAIQRINGHELLLPHTSEPLFLQPAKQILYNSNLIRFNPDATIILFEDNIQLAYHQQKIHYLNLRKQMIESQLEYWESEIDKYNQGTNEYNRQQPEGFSNSPFESLGEKADAIKDTIQSMRSLLDFEEEQELNKPSRSLFNVDRTADYIFSSFYGPASGLEQISLTTLNRRPIYWLHFGEIGENELLTKFLNAYGILKGQSEQQEFTLNITFMYVPQATNTLNLEKNGIQFFSQEDLLLKAYEKGVTIPQELHKELDKYLQKLGQNRNLKFLIENIIGEKSYNLLVAKRGAGKTWVSLGIAYALATKHSFVKRWKVKRAARVLYINGEVSDELMQDRCSIFKRMYANRNGVENVIVKTMLDLDLVEENDRKRLENEIYKPGDSGGPFSLIILDSLLFLSPTGSQGSNWKDKIEPWIRKLKDNQKSILLLHHKSRKDSAYGSIMLENYADCILMLEKSKTNADNTIQIKITEDRNKRAIEQEPFEIRLSTGKKPKWTPVYSETELNWKMSEEKKIKQIIELRKKDTPVQKIADLFGKHINTIEKFMSGNGITKSKKKPSTTDR
jgi:AAA domain-containing protein